MDSYPKVGCLPPIPTKDLFCFEMDIMTSSTGSIWTKLVRLP